MAQVIHKIIRSKNPRIHYKVGAFLQKFSIVLKRILPRTTAWLHQIPKTKKPIGKRINLTFRLLK